MDGGTKGRGTRGPRDSKKRRYEGTKRRRDEWTQGRGHEGAKKRRYEGTKRRGDEWTKGQWYEGTKGRVLERRDERASEPNSTLLLSSADNVHDEREGMVSLQ